MIIGKNNNLGKPNFVTNNTTHNNNINNSSNINQQRNILNPMNETTTTFNHSNIMDKDEMKNKSFAMLQERLSNGTISLEEFNKKCHELGKNNK